MGIKLESIELKNIRSHSDFLFKPKENGITVISGENGTGKSSIVNSLAWTLFSTKPKGVSKAKSIMKTGVPYKKGDFFSEVILQVDDEYLKIRKTIVSKSGSTECEAWSSQDLTSWKEEAGPAVSHTEAWIKKRLQMDEKEFLASVLIQQKQVDQLIVASPQERSQVIEKLTGISSITEAVSLARKEYNQLQKTLGGTDVNEEGLKNLQKEQDVKNKNISQLDKKIENLEKEVSYLTEEKNELKDFVEENETKKDQINALENKKEIFTIQIENKNNLLEEIIKDKQAKKEQFSKFSKNYNIDELSKKLTNLEKDLDNINETLGNYNYNVKNLRHQEEEYFQILEKSKIKDVEKAKNQNNTNNKNLDKANSYKNKLKQDKYSYIGFLDSLHNAIQAIEQHEGTCPTCLQKVPDIKTTVDNLQEQCEEVEKDIANTDDKISKNDEKISKFEENIEKFRILIEAFNIDEVKQEIEKFDKDINVKEAEKQTLNKEIMTIRKMYAESENYETAKQEYNNLLNKAQYESKNLEKLESNLLEVNKKLKNSKMPSMEEFNKKRALLNKKTSELSEKRENLIRTKSNIDLEKEKNNSLTKEIKQLEEDLEKYKKLLNSVEVSLNTVNVLEEFRIERIKSSVSILEQYASEFLAKFTDNKFSGITLDTKFNATILLPDGTERAIGLLSGGELSAAAIALRLAIAFLLGSDDNKNLLILDEVLASQDSSRVESILDSIKETIKGQVILIAHNDSIKSIADKVIEL